MHAPVRGFEGEVAVFDAVQLEGHGQVRIDRSRDALLTDFGKATLDDRYLMPGECYQDLFARVASRLSATTQRMRSASTTTSRSCGSCRRRPVLSNGGTTRGLPISCFLNEASDSLDGIVGLWNENVWLAAKGGGIGSYWGNLRGIGEKVGANGKTSGVDPLHPGDGQPDAGDQPGLAAARVGGLLPAGAATRRSRSSSRSAARPAATRTARR